MELANQGSLETFLRKSHHILTPSAKISLAKDIVMGLSFIHHNRFVHLDLKTSNILVHFPILYFLGIRYTKEKIACLLHG